LIRENFKTCIKTTGMSAMKADKNSQGLIKAISALIDQSKLHVAIAANATITGLYWRIGQQINDNILNNKRGGYGKQIVVLLARQLTLHYGRSFEEKNLRRMMQFNQVFKDEEIVVSAIRQLTWTHFIALIPIKDELKRNFYMQMCRIENWSVQTLRAKIDGLLFERTAISKKPNELIKNDLKLLAEQNIVSPDLIFKSPLFLDFTGLKDTYSEKSLEDAILKELESFILELGKGFAFIERQKRMIIDGEDFHLDLLFFHRGLKRLIAIELKLDKFKAKYKGQMELYLRWLQQNEMQDGEQTPLGLILCAEGNNEQIELLQLESAGIKVAEYLTELPDKKMLEKKLHKVIEQSRKRMEDK
jgi:predicted nuclease of restriction endonuclease-like (RecB) superfamily